MPLRWPQIPYNFLEEHATSTQDSHILAAADFVCLSPPPLIFVLPTSLIKSTRTSQILLHNKGRPENEAHARQHASDLCYNIEVELFIKFN